MPSTNQGTTDGGTGQIPDPDPTPNPTPDPNPDPGGQGGGGGGGGPVAGGNIGPDGVIELFPTAAGGTKWYLNMNAAQDPHDGLFNISYGGGSHIKSTKPAKENGVTFFNSVGAVQNYNSGSPSSRSCRFDNYPGGGQFSNNTNYSWKSNPGYLYNQQGIKNKEMTCFVRPHGQLKTHESCAFKVNGRDNDDIRSAIEIVYPTATHSTVVVNYNFAHFPYVAEKNVKQVFTGDKLTDGRWVGIKGIHKISDDGKVGYLAVYADLNPFKPDGSVNNQFKLKAECVTRGVSGYNNIVCHWKCHKDVLRVDGFRNVDYTLFSNREISNAGMKTSL